MKRQKILILHFPNLNNYGTGMMGLVTIQALADRFGADNVEFYCDFNQLADIDEIKSELRGEIILKKYINENTAKIGKIKNPFYRKIRILLHLLFNFEGKGFDKMIVLGGDDLSEYYSRHGAALEIMNYWKSSFRTKVILLGQTLGPFSNPLNRFASKYLLTRLNIYARDRWCVEYMKNEYGLKIHAMVDLALSDLPLQTDNAIESKILEKYNLLKNNYFTIVVSGLQGEGYYCNDLSIYLNRYKEMIEIISRMPQLNDKTICLLAHTFPPYGDEVTLLKKLILLIPEDLQQRLVLVRDRILETRARFILGNGMFTLTGRMHAAVSTFQMGKPSICLSYSAKFKGVIGDSIGRNDLVIESNNNRMWCDKTVVAKVGEKVCYLLNNYEQIKNEITERVSEHKKKLLECFQII